MRVRGNQREKGVRDRQVGWEGQLNWAESSGAPERKAEPGRNPCRRCCCVFQLFSLVNTQSRQRDETNPPLAADSPANLSTSGERGLSDVCEGWDETNHRIPDWDG